MEYSETQPRSQALPFFEETDPGRGWSRVTRILRGKLKMISGRGSRGVCLLRLENCNFMCYRFRDKNVICNKKS